MMVLPLVLGQKKFTLLSFVILGCSSFIGIILCLIWSNLIQQYRLINQRRFQVIHDMEEKLPYPCYTSEWRKLSEQHNYLGLTSVERVIPLICSIPYVILLLYACYELIKVRY